MKAYKADQGRLARMAAFWAIALMLLFGCTFLHAQLTAYVGSMKEPIGGLRLPIVGVDVTPSFVLTSALFLVGMIVLMAWQQKPKVADLLIETESELRKVTWPTLTEVVNSSMVVIVFVALLMGFLAASDWVLNRVFGRLILGG